MAGDKAIIFGGCGITASASPAVFNETWLLSTSEPMKWEQADVMGDVPSARWRHTATLLPDKLSILVFGGLCKGKRFNDTYVFSSDKKEWNIKECSGPPPHPRSHHSASLVQFDEDDSESPPNSKVFIVGGYGGPSTSRDFFMDVHILELDTYCWTKVGPPSSPARAPPPSAWRLGTCRDVPMRALRNASSPRAHRSGT